LRKSAHSRGIFIILRSLFCIFAFILSLTQLSYAEGLSQDALVYLQAAQTRIREFFPRAQFVSVMYSSVEDFTRFCSADSFVFLFFDKATNQVGQVTVQEVDPVVPGATPSCILALNVAIFKDHGDLFKFRKTLENPIEYLHFNYEK